MPDTKFVDKISDELQHVMYKDFIAYETEHGIDINYKKFSIIISDESGEEVGVLNAYTAFAEVYVDDLWVHSTARNKGYGRQLLSDLENHFKGKGFNNINLCTSAFNAPKFYERCGFQPEFTRINKKNPKLNKTFYVKYFDDKVQKQGILD